MAKIKRTNSKAPVAEVEVQPMAAPVVEREREEGAARFDVINGFVLEDTDKLDRVIYGDVKRQGIPEGGLGEDADPVLVLARYDRLAGLITKDIGGDRRVKIKTGSFWDFRAKAPRKEPQVLYIFDIGGEFVEVDDPSKLAAAISTLSTASAEKERASAAKRDRARRKSLIRGGN